MSPSTNVLGSVAQNEGWAISAAGRVPEVPDYEGAIGGACPSNSDGVKS